MILPRLAVGTVQPDTDPTLAVWSLLSGLAQAGLSLQTFRHQATFAPYGGSLVITGREERHLDSWLMPQEVCRQFFQQNARDVELAVVAGRYDVASPARSGGSLDALCQWLDLPRIVVLNTSQLDPCRLRPLPFPVDGLIIEGAATAREVAHWETTLESAWRAPILAAIDDLGDVRRQLNRVPAGAKPSEDLCRRLGERLRPNRSFGRLVDIAARPFDAPARLECVMVPDISPTVKLRVAMAFDEAFHCYYPDTLDCLEALGIELRLFSPLRSAELPRDTDVVYLGCGHLEAYADELAANHCLKQAIERFAARGGRIYAEGAGTAYLCRQVVIAGRRLPMAGALSAIATWNPAAAAPRPAVVHLSQNTWIGEAYQELRGYLNAAWQLAAWGGLCDLALEVEHRGALVAQRNVIASRLHVNFAAHPQFLHRFPVPARASLVVV